MTSSKGNDSSYVSKPLVDSLVQHMSAPCKPVNRNGLIKDFHMNGYSGVYGINPQTHKCI